MLGKAVPALDPAAQWPEGFEVERTILPLPDKLAALVYRARGRDDPFLASRATIILLSSLAVVAFVPLALAFYRQAWAAAVATIIYAACFGAYARTSGNYLREDFALPGILPATAGVVYLLTGASGKRRWLAFAATTIAALWQGHAGT
jgi:hypothetical protein